VRRLLYRVAGKRLAYRAAQRYVAGTDRTDALEVARRLVAEGKAVSLDLIGPAADSQGEAEATAAAYVDLAESLPGVGGDAYLSIDLSQVGLDISPDFCRRLVERIVPSLPPECRLQVGAEESERADAVVDVVLALAHDGAPVMPTLQANLRRSPSDSIRFGEVGLPVRLVKGAFVEPPEVAHPRGESTDLAYLRLARELDAAGCEVALATHDRAIREELLASLRAATCELLLGVRPEDGDDLIRRGHRVRVYVPFGERWLPYLLRRLAEAR
jgi:proline dehydrogenase